VTRSTTVRHFVGRNMADDAISWELLQSGTARERLGFVMSVSVASWGLDGAKSPFSVVPTISFSFGIISLGVLRASAHAKDFADPQKNAANRQGGWLQIGMVAGFISERWPASNRNPGRLHLGTPGRIKLESLSPWGISSLRWSLGLGRAAAYQHRVPS